MIFIPPPFGSSFIEKPQSHSSDTFHSIRVLYDVNDVTMRLSGLSKTYAANDKSTLLHKHNKSSNVFENQTDE